MSGQKKRTKKKSFNGFFFALILILCVIIGGCLYVLIPKVLDYKASDDAYEKIRANAVTNDSGFAVDDSTVSTATDDMSIDWNAFPEGNCVAWIKMDDISYPVMQSSSVDYYLHRLPDGTKNSAGSIFLYYKNSPLFTDRHSIIYGHNMANGSMFGKLKEYVSTQYSSHHFYVYLPDGTRHRYLFYSIGTVNKDSDAYTYSFGSDETFMDWLNLLKQKSKIDCAAQPDVNKRYVTLSTCNGAAGTSTRLILTGQEDEVVKVSEPASWYAQFFEAQSGAVSSRKKAADDILTELDAFCEDNRKSVLGTSVP